MSIEFNHYMMNCMNIRTDEIINDMAANNKAYKAMTQKIIRISNTIDSVLPPEYKKVLDELEDIQCKRELIVHKKLYWQALKDGIKLCNVFHRLK